MVNIKRDISWSGHPVQNGLHLSSSAMAISQMSLAVSAQILLPICKIVTQSFPYYMQNCYKIYFIFAKLFCSLVSYSQLGCTQSQTCSHLNHLDPLTRVTPLSMLDREPGLVSSLSSLSSCCSIRLCCRIFLLPPHLPWQWP